MHPLFIIPISLVILILTLAYISYRMVFYADRKKQPPLYRGLDGELDDIKKRKRELIEKLASLPFEDVYITGHGGLRLHAKYYEAKKNAPLAIQLHGYKSLSVRDFCGGVLECLALGQNVLLVDQRAHAESGGRTISFGIRERRDAVLWINYANERFGGDTPIFLYGISMGAATVLMASELQLPENVSGIIADCPYSSIGGIIRTVCKKRGLPSRILYPFIWLGAIIFGGFLINRGPLQAVRNTDIPILLIHGEGDTFVPISMSDELARDGATVEYVRIPNATHGLSMLYDRDTYVSAVEKFINKYQTKEKNYEA